MCLVIINAELGLILKGLMFVLYQKEEPSTNCRPSQRSQEKQGAFTEVLEWSLPFPRLFLKGRDLPCQITQKEPMQIFAKFCGKDRGRSLLFPDLLEKTVTFPVIYPKEGSSGDICKGPRKVKDFQKDSGKAQLLYRHS